MCTLALELGASSDLPLRVAANRDEALGRASEPPQLWTGEPRLLAPRDTLGGGTWLALNAHGLFVAITNRFGAAKDPTRRSRGLLVLEAARRSGLEDVESWLRGLDVAAYSPFHLVYANVAGAGVTAWTGEQRLSRRLAPGLHVFTERSFGAGDDATRVETFRQRWPRAYFHQEAAALLATHRDDAPFDAPCVHAPAFHYGTRSALTLELRARLEESSLRFTEGPPCASAFQSGAALLRELARE